MFDRRMTFLIGLCLQASLLVPLAGAIEVPAQPGSAATTQDAVRIRVYVQPYPASDRQFAEDQMQIASEVLADASETLPELRDCEIVGGKDALKALGGRIPSPYEMEQDKWELARQAGRTMRADYVLIGYRSMEMNNMNFSGTLINVRTGAVQSVLNTGSSEGVQSANPAGMAHRLGRTTYTELIRKAKRDIIATAAKKREDPAAEPMIVKDTTPPTVVITSPEAAGGKIAVSSPVLRVAGKVTDKGGVQEVWVNDKNAALSGDGNFDSEVVLAVGMNEVVIAAVDVEGNKSTQTLKVTRQSARAANKVYVYVQPYPSSDRRFVEDQMQIASEVLSELENCEVVDSRDALKMFGGRIPTPFEMEKDKWALAVRSGKVFDADYVLIGYRSMDMNNMNFSGTLINVRTGAVQSVLNTGSSEGVQSANPAGMAQRLGRTTYAELIRKAKRDIDVTAARKRENPVVAAVKKSLPAPALPVIVITAPDITRGVKIVKTQKLLVAGVATAEGGVSGVSVNDVKAAIGKDGKFSAEISLDAGANEVTVVAVDAGGNRGVKTFPVDRRVQEKSGPPPAARQGEFHALIIGNNNYRHIPRLETARKDAIEIEKVLREQFGFRTKLLLDATRNDILDAVNGFRRSLGEADSFLIYYAGHGEFDRRGDKAYWLPVDAQKDTDTNWIIADDLTINMKRIASKHVLIIADSCYSGALTRSFNADLEAKGRREEFIRKMARKASRTLMASGGNEPVSDSGGSGHSVFAEALLKALAEIDYRTFTAEELFHGYIKERVAGGSEQTPEYDTIRNSGHDGGDFVFEKR